MENFLFNVYIIRNLFMEFLFIKSWSAWNEFNSNELVSEAGIRESSMKGRCPAISNGFNCCPRLTRPCRSSTTSSLDHSRFFITMVNIPEVSITINNIQCGASNYLTFSLKASLAEPSRAEPIWFDSGQSWSSSVSKFFDLKIKMLDKSQREERRGEVRYETPWFASKINLGSRSEIKISSVTFPSE